LIMQKYNKKSGDASNTFLTLSSKYLTI